MAASSVVDCTQLSSGTRRISSFVVLDLEANGLPHIFSKIAITELCMYGFAASELETEPMNRKIDGDSPVLTRPRILHKLTLLFNPRRLIHPDAENITGLNNYNLENESHFDENAGNTIINFLKHMQQPVCLVAHNGDVFDFPIIKQTFEKLNLQLPHDIICVDSLRAFWGIDDQLKLEEPCTDTTTSNTAEESASATDLLPLLDLDATDGAYTFRALQALEKQIKTDEKVNWQERNETTPKRPTVAGVKRPATDHERTPKKISLNGNDIFKSKRALFTSKPISKYPPKNVYKLGKLYERHFKAKPKEEHYAEADVETLMNLMQVYGIDFLAFAENHAIPFREIKIRR